MSTAYNVTRTELERITQYNRNLLAALNEARNEITALKGGSDRAAQRPAAYGVFLGRLADRTPAAVCIGTLVAWPTGAGNLTTRPWWAGATKVWPLK